MWSDESRLENGRISIVTIGFNVLEIWKSKMLAFGDNKEIFNAEFYDIYLVL